MKKNYKIKLVCLLCVFTAVFSGCKKNEAVDEMKLVGNQKNLAIAGDGKWDLLGHGFDATGELARESASDVSIIDIDRFNTEYPGRITTPTDTEGDYEVFLGATAYDYVKDMNTKRTLGGSATFKSEKADEGKLYGTANFSNTNENQNTYTYYSKYSYATYESWFRIKSINFTGDATVDLLTNYLTPLFISNLSTYTPTQLVERYGTHVLLGIDIGGRLVYDYKGAVVKETTFEKKVENIKAGFSIGIAKIFSIDLNADLNTEQKTTIANETTDKLFRGKFYGGNDGGVTFTGDVQGNISISLNLSNWQKSINVYNASLIKITKSVPIYDFITDPVKKQQVKDAVEKYISDRQIKDLGEVPVYAYRNSKNGDRYFTPEDKPYIGNDVNFKKEGIAFYAFSKPTERAVPIYAYRNSKNGDRYFTPDDKPYIGNDFNFKKEGIAFYAYSKPTEGAVPIYAYRNSKTGDRYFTPDDKPFIGNDVNFKKEGTAFYAYK